MTTLPKPTIVEKNGSTRFHVGWSNFKGEVRLDVREWYLDHETGEWKPSRKGVSVPPHKAEEFGAAVLRITNPEGAAQLYGEEGDDG